MLLPLKPDNSAFCVLLIQLQSNTRQHCNTGVGPFGHVTKAGEPEFAGQRGHESEALQVSHCTACRPLPSVQAAAAGFLTSAFKAHS